MKIQFCGAAREVTGSSHLITLDSGYKILLDCGLYQGHSDEMANWNKRWYFEPTDIDCLILSHAHIDHTGRVPKLVKDGFKGTIHSTHATRSLCSIMLLDSAFIQERDAAYFNKRNKSKIKKGRYQPEEPLYSRKDVGDAMELFHTYGYNQWVRIHKDVEVLFKDAGHILGSASVTLKIVEQGKTTLIGFSGDVGRPERPILRDPRQMPDVDYVICESTYGDKDHLSAPSEMERFLQIIKNTCEKEGKLLIPAFSIGRTQEIVYMLDQLETAGKLPKIPVFVDSPLAVNATTIFGSHPECFDQQLNEYLLIDDNPFGFNELTYVHDLEVSKTINKMKGPCIVISASGMMNAGRSKHHLFNSVDQPQNTVLIVGYCAPETPGGKLIKGVEEIKLFGELKPVRAAVEIMDSFSAHADRNELLAFLDNQKKRAKKLFLVHGTLDRQESLKTFLKENGFSGAIQIPKLGEEVHL